MPKYILIGLIVVIGTFLILNYWPRINEITKNKIIASIFGLIGIGFVVLIALLIFWIKLSPLYTVVKKLINSTIKWYMQSIISDIVINELRGNS